MLRAVGSFYSRVQKLRYLDFSGVWAKILTTALLGPYCCSQPWHSQTAVDLLLYNIPIKWHLIYSQRSNLYKLINLIVSYSSPDMLITKVIVLIALLAVFSQTVALRMPTKTAAGRNVRSTITLSCINKQLLQLLLRGGSNHFIAEGTPFEKPKIGNSIVDLVGGTPMVRNWLRLCNEFHINTVGPTQSPCWQCESKHIFET